LMRWCEAAAELRRMRATLGRIAARQGLTLVHFSAYLERFLWDGGCA
jgi:hypothetical protein